MRSHTIEMIVEQESGFFTATAVVLAVAVILGRIRRQIRTHAARRRDAALDAYVLRELFRSPGDSVGNDRRRRLMGAASPALFERS